ncbi:hypothetical protein PS691_02010 [Pseudomonas fluorescens]|uniref:Uncharacterized protein n=1 Tax=Pseudomonas fluorescens TaxID=294 RepID=A0A5E7CB95_PSEFL|nr:hypothetical protein PS691_02010 [Pseudomonas fluorescens]
MTYMVCYRLIPISGSVISHGFQKATHSFLVIWSDAVISLQQLLIVLTQINNGHWSPGTCNDVKNVDSQSCHSGKVRGIWIPGAPLVAALRVAIFTADESQILLFQIEPGPFFAKTITYAARYFFHRRTIFQACTLYKTK